MPRAKDYCARRPLHPGRCATRKAYVDRNDYRPRKTARRVGHIDPTGPARWRRASKLKRYGLTEERFTQMLADQGYACGMCHESFEDGQPVFIDHDHACCPDQSGKLSMFPGPLAQPGRASA